MRVLTAVHPPFEASNSEKNALSRPKTLFGAALNKKAHQGVPEGDVPPSVCGFEGRQKPPPPHCQENIEL
jgi:hypothetical protein